MTAHESIVSDLQESRRRFLALVEDVRPDLHRYCARMTGSIAEGEDVVQDALAAAYYELAELERVPALRPWLFRIAHRRALDRLRRYERRMSEPLEAAVDVEAASTPDPDGPLARQDAVRAAVSLFVELAAAQRSCVILKDVLDHSLDEIAAMLDLSVPAVKAALHRGRTRLRELLREPRPPAPPRDVSPAVARYVSLFNARDWDGVRAMLVDDVKLDLVSRARRAGRREVSDYFTNYGRTADWHLVPARLDGREVVAVVRDPRETRPAYFMELTLAGDLVATIRDFRYVPYIARDAAVQVARST
jgi:RNA polymerase sigma factor (sigma-70 family)